MFKMDVAGDVAVMHIYGPIGWDGITARQVADELDNIGDVERIHVRINSEGGHAFDGVAIMNQLMSSQLRVDVTVDGLAASAASVIAMAGDSITMAAGAMMMVHNPMGFVMGGAEEMRSTANVLDAITDQVAGIYAARTSIDHKGVRALMDAETWLGAAQAVDMGFATNVAEDRERIAAKWDLSRYTNVPDDLKTHSEPRPVVAATPPVEDAPEDGQKWLRSREAKIRHARAFINYRGNL